jgi:hypothetical protein
MSRINRGASWCAILTTFAAFSVMLLWGMAGVGAASTVPQAVSKLEKSGVAKRGRGGFVAVKVEGNLLDRVAGHDAMRVCWVTNAQLQVIQSRWRTTVTQVGPYSVATVYAPGVSSRQMRAYVSGGKRCVLVHVKPFFFLPIEGGVS